MNLSMRNKLLAKLIGDIDMLGDGAEPDAKDEKEAPADLEVLSIENEKPEEESSEEPSGEESKCDDCGGPKGECDLKDCKFKDASAEDGESLGEDGLMPHERLRKLMGAKG